MALGSVLEPEAWVASGCLVEADDSRMWIRTSGRVGPWRTFLCDALSTSWDWGRVEEHIQGRNLFVDRLGQGASGHPRGLYTVVAEYHRLRQVWFHLGIEETDLVVHGDAVAVAQEVLARMQEGTYKGPRIRRVVFLNGPLLASKAGGPVLERLARTRLLGWKAALFLTRRRVARWKRRAAGRRRPPGPVYLDRAWRAFHQPRARRTWARMMRMHKERVRNEDRWQQALLGTPVPIRIAWGGQDPDWGPVMVAWLRGRPRTRVALWPDVGRYPHLEVPQRVADVL